MSIDILNLSPTTISRDLKGKYICIYGLPKSGKTTFAAQAPRNLLIAFEKGYNAIAGIKAVDITRWVDFKMVLKQLSTDKAKEMYDTVSIDTVGIMWQMCEQYICLQNNVQNISDIPWGKGFSLCSKEFEQALRSITMLGYGLIIISHVDVKTEAVGEDESRQIIGPSIPKRGYAIVNQLVDIIGYISTEYDEDGGSHQFLQTRASSTIMAGSRFPNLPLKIPFGYKELSEALADAIEQSGKNGATIVDRQDTEIKTKTFEEVRQEGAELWEKLIKVDPENATKVIDIVQKVTGQRMKLSDITPSQQDLFEFIIAEMRDMLK